MQVAGELKEASVIASDILADPYLDSAIGMVGRGTRLVSGTPQFDVQEKVRRLLAKLSIETIANMKAMSKTGATGFGQLNEKELEVIQNNIVNLNLQQGAAFRKNLAEVIKRSDKQTSVLTDSFKRKYKGDILKIKNKLGATYITSEHLVLAIRVPKKHKFLYIGNKMKLSPEWHHAGWWNRAGERTDLAPIFLNGASNSAIA